MLDRFENGRGFECNSESAAPVTTGVRDLGLAPGNQGGMWVLPMFSAEVPMQISQGDSKKSSLADFMLLAHKKGIRIPDSIYTTTTEVLTQQFSGYAKEQLKDLSIELPLDVSIDVVDSRIELAGHATERQQKVFQLKGPVERLNALAPGLGWFISETISHSHRVGLPTYEPNRVASCVQQIWFDAQTDREVAAEVHGIEEADVTDEDIEQARNERTFMPSDLLASVDGHKNLLSWSQSEEERAATRSMRPPDVRACLDKLSLTDSDRSLVQSALAFLDSIDVKKRNSLIAPNGWFEHEEELLCQGMEPVGSLAFIVWEDSEVTFEAVNHYEEYVMNGEGALTQVVGIRVELDEPKSWAPFIDAFKLYIKRYAAFSKFIGALPEET